MTASEKQDSSLGRLMRLVLAQWLLGLVIRALPTGGGLRDLPVIQAAKQLAAAIMEAA